MERLFADANPGLVYAYRVSGEYAPEKGMRYNANKVLLDPYARQVIGQYDGQDAFSGESEIDTAVFALKGKVVNEVYDWENVASPRIPTAQMVLYELHPKGFTRLHPDIPENIRGTYAALAEPSFWTILKGLV